LVLGKGLYTGSKTLSFKILPLNKNGESPTLASQSLVYGGGKITPSVKFARTTIAPTDYKVSYTDNVNIGTATATITGVGDYTGSVKKTFSIIPAKAAMKTAKSPKEKPSRLFQNPRKVV